MKIREDVGKLALPVLTEQFFAVAMGVINTIIASRVGKEAISAIGSVDSINNIVIMFFSALAVGGTVAVAQYTGRRSYTEANEAANQALLSGLVLSLVSTGLIWLTRDMIISALYSSAEDVVLQYCRQYFSISLLSYPFIAFSFTVSGVMRGAGHPDKPMKVNIIMNFANIVFSYLLIYGIHIGNSHVSLTIPAFGVRGAAMGLFSARLLGAGLFLYILLKDSSALRLKKEVFFRVNMHMQKTIFNIGVPNGVESFLFNIGKLTQQVFIVGLGTASMAANSITWSIFGILIIPGSALSIIATTLVGQRVGNREYDEAKTISMYLVKLGALSMLLVCLVVFPLAPAIASVYSDNSEVVHMTAFLIRMNTLGIPLLWATSFILPSALKGAGDVGYTMITAIISLWVFRVVVGYILCISLGFGIPGLWSAMFMDWIFRGFLYYTRFAGHKWRGRSIGTASA